MRIASYQVELVGPWWLRHSKCVIYFDLIAGCEHPFTIREANAVAKARRATVEEPQEFKAIGRYLNMLAGDGLLLRELGSDRFPIYTPTCKGALW